MSTTEWHWLKLAQLDKQQNAGGGFGGVSEAAWAKARAEHDAKMKARGNG